MSTQNEITCNQLAGDWRIYQLRGGHRWNTDDLLVAWNALRVAPDAERLLDLGSGVGSIGLLTLRRLPGTAQLTAVEAQEVSVGLARQTLALNQVTDRVQLIHSDLRAVSAEGPPGFDLITGNPPYLPEQAATRPRHPQKAYARLELRGDVFDYCRVAAANLAPGGWLSFCHAARDPRPPRAVAAAGLALRAAQPIIFREGKAPTITVYTASWSGRREDRAPLLVRDAAGRWTPEMRAIRDEMGLSSAPAPPSRER